VQSQDELGAIFDHGTATGFGRPEFLVRSLAVGDVDRHINNQAGAAVGSVFDSAAALEPTRATVAPDDPVLAPVACAVAS
jgi:hypothetical protein